MRRSPGQSGQSRRRAIRLPVVLTANVAVLATIFACCNPGPQAPPGAHLSLCAVDAARAVDFPQDACVSGDFRATGKPQELRLAATDKDGKPLASASISLTIGGANSASATLTSDANGAATYSYTGGAAGTDTIRATLGSGDGAPSARPAVIHWLAPHSAVHPIILVHGIQEDALDFAHQIDPSNPNAADADQLSDGSEQTWTALIEALTTVYDHAHMTAFCYVDDPAWKQGGAACPAPETSTCAASDTCVSQSSVDENALMLAKVVDAQSAAAGNKPVTLLAYSMGGAITRTLLAGCINPADGVTARCAASAAKVDATFFLDGAQQGSWLMTVKRGVEATTLSIAGTPSGVLAPFQAVLPLLLANIYGVVKDKMGLGLNDPAETDLTPQSANIKAHNSVAPAAQAQLYTFYGDVQFGMDVSFFTYTLPAQASLPMGDLVMLAQDDHALSTPLWGGASLCDSCPALADGYHESGQYHAWALTDRRVVNVNGLVPLLSAPDAVSSFKDVLNSPVQHLNVSQPGTQAPGSAIQVHDITGKAGGVKTDMPNEIVLILMKADGLI